MAPKVGVPVDNAKEIVGIAVGVVNVSNDCLGVIVVDRESTSLIFNDCSNFCIISGAERIKNGCDLG